MSPSRCLAVCLLAVVACGGAQLPHIHPIPLSAPRPLLPRNADELARAVVGAELEAMVEVARVSESPIARLVMGLGTIFDATAIVVLRDFDRVFVGAKSTGSPDDVIVVVEHHATPVQVTTAMQTMVERSGIDSSRLIPLIDTESRHIWGTPRFMFWA